MPVPNNQLGKDTSVQHIQLVRIYSSTKYSAGKDIPVQNIQFKRNIPVQNIQTAAATTMAAATIMIQAREDPTGHDPF
jgi:hypothetical protein